MVSNETPAASGDYKQTLLHMAEAYAIEQALIALLIKPVTEPLEKMRKALLLSWSRTFHTLKGVQKGPQLTVLMSTLATDMSRLNLQPQTGIIDAARRGIEIGLKHGFAEAGRKPRPLHVPLDSGVYSYAAGVSAAVRQKLDAARAIAENTQHATLTQASRPLDVATSAANIVEQSITTVFHEHLNLAVGAVIEDLGVLKMWLAEPDACDLCRPLSGRVVPAHGVFPAVLTHGSRLIDWIPDAGLDGPPLHPRCRCRLVPYEPR